MLFFALNILDHNWPVIPIAVVRQGWDRLLEWRTFTRQSDVFVVRQISIVGQKSHLYIVGIGIRFRHRVIPAVTMMILLKLRIRGIVEKGHRSVATSIDIYNWRVCTFRYF